MRFAVYTNSLSEHQVPLAREIVSCIGAENFRYIYDGSSSQAFQQSIAAEEWILPYNSGAETTEKFAQAEKWLVLAEVVLVGGLRPIELMERRAAKGLTTLYMSERWFKPISRRISVLGLRLIVRLPGWVRMWVPSYRKMTKRFVRLVNENACVKFLPIGPHATWDFCRIGVRDEKMVAWGDFVSPGRHIAARGPLEVAERTVMRVLWVGRMLYWKRVEDIVRAVDRANEALASKGSGGNIHLTLVGAGAEEDRIGKRIAKSRHSAFITCRPPVTMDAVRGLMRENDVYVFASDETEGWGCVVSEALEEGMRVIGTYEAGASAAILPKERLFHAGDVGALASLLIKELRGELPDCQIGDWTAKAAATRLLKEVGWRCAMD